MRSWSEGVDTAWCRYESESFLQNTAEGVVRWLQVCWVRYSSADSTVTFLACVQSRYERTMNETAEHTDLTAGMTQVTVIFFLYQEVTRFDERYPFNAE
jgi:hypothetical protein